jgi:hypothetical protein
MKPEHSEIIEEQLNERIPPMSCSYRGPEALYLNALCRAYARGRKHGFDSPRYRYARHIAYLIHEMMEEGAMIYVEAAYDL